MRKTMALAMLVASTACGGSSAGPTVPAATPPPAKALVTMNLDPKVQTAESQGNGYWRFKVNQEFIETGGVVGFTLNTIRVTLTAPSGTILQDKDYPEGDHIAAGGRKVYQFTSGQYFTNFNTGVCSVVVVASITDDKGNALTVSNSMSVQHVGSAIELQ